MGGGGRPQHLQLLHPEKVQKDPAHREGLRPEEGKGGGLLEAAPLSQTLKKQVYEQRNCLAEFELSW